MPNGSLVSRVEALESGVSQLYYCMVCLVKVTDEHLTHNRRTPHFASYCMEECGHLPHSDST